jgi:hypothetical protein
VEKSEFGIFWGFRAESSLKASENPSNRTTASSSESRLFTLREIPRDFY